MGKISVKLDMASGHALYLIGTNLHAQRTGA